MSAIRTREASGSDWSFAPTVTIAAVGFLLIMLLCGAVASSLIAGSAFADSTSTAPSVDGAAARSLVDAARARSDEAAVARKKGQRDLVLSVQGQAIDAWRKALAAQPASAQLRIELANQLMLFAEDLVFGRKADQREKPVLEAVALREKLVEEEPRSITRMQQLAEALNIASDVVFKAGRRKEAMDSLIKAVALRKKIAADHPDLEANLKEMTGLYEALANQLERDGKKEEALQAFTDAMNILSDLVQAHPGDESLEMAMASHIVHYGYELKSHGRLKDAADMFQVGIDLNTTLMNDLGFPQYIAEVAECNSRLAECLQEMDKKPEALKCYQQAIRLGGIVVRQDATLPIYRSNLADYQADYGRLLFDLGKSEPARAELEAAVALYVDLYQHDRQKWLYGRPLARAYSDLARVEGGLAHPAKAIELANKGLEVVAAVNKEAGGHDKRNAAQEAELKKIISDVQAKKRDGKN